MSVPFVNRIPCNGLLLDHIKPLPGPFLTHHQVDIQGVFNEIYAIFKHVLSQKLSWNSCLQNVGYFVQTSIWRVPGIQSQYNSQRTVVTTEAKVIDFTCRLEAENSQNRNLWIHVEKVIIMLFQVFLVFMLKWVGGCLTLNNCVYVI